MTELWLIGIGTGHPGHVTMEGMQALRDAACVLIPRKGAGKEDLANLRHAILKGAGTKASVIEFDMPVRDEAKPYAERVELWHDEIAGAGKARWRMRRRGRWRCSFGGIPGFMTARCGSLRGLTLHRD